MTTQHIRLAIAALLAVASAGCMSASEHRADVNNPVGERMTVGTAQKEIRVGIFGAGIAALLGAPNIVSTDELRREVSSCVKIFTDVAYSTSSGGLPTVIFGGGGSVAGGGVGRRGLDLAVDADRHRQVRRGNKSPQFRLSHVELLRQGP